MPTILPLPILEGDLAQYEGLEIVAYTAEVPVVVLDLIIHAGVMAAGAKARCSLSRLGSTALGDSIGLVLVDGNAAGRAGGWIELSAGDSLILRVEAVMGEVLGLSGRFAVQ